MKRALRFLVCVVVLAGCASIVGIEDHVYKGNPASSQCQAYCDDVMHNCTDKYAVYASRDTCLGVCSRLPTGDPDEPVDDNSVECRARQAHVADKEPQSFCPLAGPGGGGTCGTNCQGYCALLKSTCPENAAIVPNCEQACSALHDLVAFNVVANHEGDTLQCRLVHVSSATAPPSDGHPDPAAEHCPHTQIHPVPPWCIEDQTKPPDCTEFCRLALAACPGDYAVYESTAQCMAVCAALPPGTNGDRDQNTVGCREWHCYNSLLDPLSHCPHTGPGGDAHCGADEPDDTGNCFAYCYLLAGACGTDLITKFGNPATMTDPKDPIVQAACQKDCSNMPAAFGAKKDSKYKISAAQTGNTLQCRLLHTSRALTDPTECPSAFGNAGSACQ